LFPLETVYLTPQAALMGACQKPHQPWCGMFPFPFLGVETETVNLFHIEQKTFSLSTGPDSLAGLKPERLC